MINEKAIIIKGLSKEYYKKDSSHSGFFDKLKPNKSGQSFFALKDINLEINKGEVIGIIGPNGAGKSTLLKILAEVTPPTSGSVEIFGKVASILEIGIGFQPELSGYENIFLSGQLYGLSKKQILSKLDKIIEMFGFPDFIDTEVKHYSSGMYMRLAFSIIINIEADIYLFDEILSVGDAAFQGRALEEIEKLRERNAVILLVTHAPEQSLKIYDKILYLENGEYQILGEPYPVFLQYLNKSNKKNTNLKSLVLNADQINIQRNFASNKISCTSFEIRNLNNRSKNIQINCLDNIIIELSLFSTINIDFQILILIKDNAENKIGFIMSKAQTIKTNQTIYKTLNIEKDIIAPGSFIIDLMIVDQDSTVFASYHNLIKFEAIDNTNSDRISITGFIKIPVSEN